jgi:hypothetical protein
LNYRARQTGSLTTAKLHRDWLRRLPELTGKSRTAIADEIGIARTTLTKPLKPTDPGTSTLNATTIEKIVIRYGIPGPGSADDPGVIPGKKAALAQDAQPYVASEGGSFETAVRALVGDRMNVKPWRIETRAVEMEGYLPGDVVLVELGAKPHHGDIVCAEVFDLERGRADTVMRVFEEAGPVKLLVAKTMDPKLQRSLVVDGDRVAVRGVLWPHRLRPHAGS